MYGIRPSCRVAILVLTLALDLPVLGDPGSAPDFERRLGAARDALAAGRPDDAERLYRELVAADPEQVEPYRGLAEVYVARGRPEAAVALILQVARKLIPSRRYGAAIAPLERAAALAPEVLEVHVLLARALAEERRYASAAQVYERALGLGESGLETLLYLAACYWESERYDAAEATYALARERHGDAFETNYQLGQFLLWQGRAAEAVAPLERAAAQHERSEVVFYLARARAESGDATQAIASYQRLLELDGESSALGEKARRALELLRRRDDSSTSGRLRRDAAARPRRDGGTPVSTDHDRVVLTPAAEGAGVHFRHNPGVSERRHLPETMGSGLAWLDYDGDGWLDLYLVQSGPFPPDGSAAAANRLLRNRGTGTGITFEDATDRAGAGERSYGQGVVAADVDGDGDIDLYLTNYGPDVLLENRGDGTFEDRTAEAGLDVGGWSSSAAFADADGDGDLDLYVSRYVDYDPAHQHRCGRDGRPDYCNVILFAGIDDRLYRQRGDRSFEDVTSESGLAGGGRGLGVVWTDLDGDRRPDLYVANDLDPNRLYRNLGVGADGRIRFADVSLLSGAAFNREGKAEAGMGVAVGDLDGDGLPELAVTNFDVETNTLYRNLGRLMFDDVSAASGFALPSFNRLGFGIALADFDGDGDLDAFIANGHVFERPRRENTGHAQADLLLLGDGHGGFREQHLAGAKIGRGVALADYDSDGDPDVAVQNNRGSAELWRNDRAPGRWIGVELDGRGLNTQAVGARVKLVTARPGAGAGTLRSQIRWVIAGQSYQSSSDRRLLFAWPADERARELEVRWPSGLLTRLLRPPEDRYLHVAEPLAPR